MKKIAITTTSFGQYDESPLRLLSGRSYEVILNQFGRKLMAGEVVELCSNSAGIVAGTESLDETILKQLSGLKVISRCGTGLDNIDLNAARKLGIKVFNTPGAPTLPVAELTIGLILNLLRKVNYMDVTIRHGRWEKVTGNLLYGKKIGLIGFGRIGRKVAELLRVFDCEIAYSDPFVEDELMGLKRLMLEELLKWADIISIHASIKDRILGEKELRFMKNGAWLLNVARGGIVDENALYRALKEGNLSGAALDVFEQEPYEGPLKELENVILTPHIASYAKESRIKMELQAVKNLLEGLGYSV